jgi:hypothetical protein
VRQNHGDIQRHYHPRTIAEVLLVAHTGDIELSLSLVFVPASHSVVESTLRSR